MNYHSSWSSLAAEAFEKNVRAHGGWPAWNDLASVHLKLVHFDGFLVALKGLGKSFFSPKTLTIDPKNRKVVFGYEGYSNVYDNGKVSCEKTKTQIADGRPLFKKQIFEAWTPEHATYFFGYAWANYIGYPFILPQFELLSWKLGSAGSRFQIRFPEGFHTHCRVQTFYFNTQNLLYRHDYHADFAGQVFYGAHCTLDYQWLNQIQVARTRQVHPRLGSLQLPSYAIDARLDF